MCANEELCIAFSIWQDPVYAKREILNHRSLHHSHVVTFRKVTGPFSWSICWENNGVLGGKVKFDNAHHCCGGWWFDTQAEVTLSNEINTCTKVIRWGINMAFGEAIFYSAAVSLISISIGNTVKIADFLLYEIPADVHNLTSSTSPLFRLQLAVHAVLWEMKGKSTFATTPGVPCHKIMSFRSAVMSGWCSQHGLSPSSICISDLLVILLGISDK